MLNPVTPAFLADLHGRLPDTAFRDVSEKYLTELRGLWRGRAGAVLAPGNVEETALILRAANDAHVPVIPIAGGTGLVGGQVAGDLPDPLVVTCERMNAIRNINPVENVLIAEAGAILQDVRQAADAAGRLFPLMLASEGSARIGGNLASNAGGMNVLRYGNARDLCLGIEAVLADGTILRGLKRLRKDNTGYDLKNLLIGSEGTLGIITAASLRLSQKPGATVTGLVAVRDPKAALDLLALAGERAGELVSIFELISGASFDFIAQTMPDHKLPLPDRPDWAVLFEIGLPAGLDGAELGETMLADAMERGLVTDGSIAQSEAQRDHLIATREAIPEANRRIGAVSSHDISLPLSAIPAFIEGASAGIAKIGPFRINAFGHLGDGNLHYNVYPPSGERRDNWLNRREEVARIVYDLVAEHDGSFSAEHGVGRARVGDLERYGDPGRITAMRAIKAALDPNGVLNPGAVLRC